MSAGPALERRGGHHVALHARDFTLHVLAHRDGIVRVVHALPGQDPPARSWAVHPVEPEPLDAAPAGEGFVLRTGRAEVEVAASGAMRVAFDGVEVLADDPGFSWREPPGGGAARPVLMRRAPPDERYYGLGEKLGPLDRRGKRLRFRNTDAYDSAYGGFARGADPLYLSIPFYLTLRAGVAAGVFADVPHELELDLAASDPSRSMLVSHGPLLDQYLIAGPALKDVVRRYTELTGRIALPPRWALGYHQCRWGYSPASRLDELAAELRRRKIPADALWLDIQHLDGFRTFTFDPQNFPDPAGLASRLEQQDLALVVIADPGIKVDEAWELYRSGLDGGHYLRRPDGSVFVGEVWPGASVFPDFSSEATRGWWADRAAGHARLGIRGLWVDMNEPANFPQPGEPNTVPDELIADGDGAPVTLAEVHNVYGSLQAQATHQGLLEGAPERRPFVLTRAGYAGVQRWAAVWTGDAPTAWWSLRDTLPMLLGLGLSGVPFAGSDTGGFSGYASGELFARWMAVGAISPFFRGHVSTAVNDQEPWSFGPRVEEICRRRITERYTLLPYLYALFVEASQSGAPILRPLIYEFQDDPRTETIDDQALLGPWLLIAPVLEAGVHQRQVYLPRGRWLELSSGRVHHGPLELSTAAPLEAAPMFLREGAIVPRQPPERTAKILPQRPRLDLFPSTSASTLRVQEDAGDGFAHLKPAGRAIVTYRLQHGGGVTRLTASPRDGSFTTGPRWIEARFLAAARPPGAVRLDGRGLAGPREPEDLEAHEGWFFDPSAQMIVVVFAENDGWTLEVEHPL